MHATGLNRLRWLWVAAAATGAYAAAMLLGTGGRLSLPLDDAYIFFQYARELVAGHPFVYNGSGPASAGVTSVPTLLVDTLAYLVGFRGDGMIVFSLLAGGAGLFLALMGAHRLGRALEMEHAWWAPLFLALNGPLLWGLYAGMDLPLYVAPLVWTLAAWAEEARSGQSRKRTIAWGSLAAAARPEALTFGFILSALLVIESLRGRSPSTAETASEPVDAGSKAPRPRRPSPLLALPLLAWLAPNLILLVFTGRFTPASLQVKGVLGLPGADLGGWLARALEYFASVLRAIFFGFEAQMPDRLQANNGSGVLFYLAPLSLPLFLLGVLPGAAREGDARRPGPHLLAVLAVLGGLTAASLVVPRAWHWHRYLIPTYALMLPFAALGLERLVRLVAPAAPATGTRGLPKAGLIAYVILALPGALYFLLAFAQNSADICFQQRALAAWTTRSLKPGALLAVNDAGALRYYGTHPILDVEGLVSPAMTLPRRHGTASLWEALERMAAAERPVYLILYPNWYDAAFLKPHRLVYQRRIFRQTIAGGNPMNVYEADWSRAGSGDNPSWRELPGHVAGKQIVDRLDVADLADEAAHDYVFRTVEGQYQELLEQQPGDRDGEPIMDGGRVISRDESFRVTGLTPGRELTIVLRSRSGFLVRLFADGAEVGEWREEGRAGSNWTESAYTVPGRLVGGREIRLRVEVAEVHATAYSVFHYWFYQ